MLGQARAHPRVGGENAFAGHMPRRSRGSSPRGRGKHRLHHVEPLPVGLIPAWAGKTGHSRQGTTRGRAHPRVGRENPSTQADGSVLSGSSPRGRGKLVSSSDNDGTNGLIPAWAGKTRSPATCPGVHAAHPRVGGENIVCTTWSRCP